MDKTVKSANPKLQEQVNPEVVEQLLNQQTTAAQAKPAVQPKPAVQAKPAVQPKPAVQAKPAVQPKPAVQAKPAVQPKPATSQPKSVAQVKPQQQPNAAPARKVNQGKPAAQENRNPKATAASGQKQFSKPAPKPAQKPAQAPKQGIQGAAVKVAKEAIASVVSKVSSATKAKPTQKPTTKGGLKIIPLGGLGEVGKNITYYEYNNEALLIDCGMAFPDESLPGIDIVIPDFTFVIENQKKIKGLCITHGHEDHIGSIPYLLKHFNLPIFGTRLTIGLIEGKLKEHGLLRTTKLNVVKPGDTVKLGAMSVEYINVNHSIPDACAVAIHTPAGVVIQTGDFKVDYTPIAGDVINLARFGELGSKGVLALLSDSTNAEKPGTTSSERKVGESLDNLFADAIGKRIIVATFASNVHRVQQIIDAAIKYGRKVAVSGRSMENVTGKSMELGYLQAPKDILITVDEAERMPSEKVAIITTGSQGEPMSALTRMARGDHRQVKVTENDCIIISATPIPGNEKLVTKVVNDLLKLGARVIYERMYEIHVSGHACQDELKLMMALTKPQFFLPVHGEFKHLRRHAELAVSMGITQDRIHIAEIGQVIEIKKGSMKQTEVVQAGRVLVDGLGIGDVGSIVLRDRMHLAEDGLIVVIATIKKATGQILSGPDIVSRGFVYVRESEDMLAKARNIAKTSIEKNTKNGNREWNVLKNGVRDDVGDFVWQTTKRRPMILPVIQEIR